MSNDTVVWAATRDASWHNHPDTTSPKRFHVDTGDGTPVCDPAGMFLVDDQAVDATTVPDFQRCRRAACRKRFDAADAASDGGV